MQVSFFIPEMNVIYLVLACLFLHIVADFWMQEVCMLTKLKCKSWWSSTTTDKLKQLKQDLKMLQKAVDKYCYKTKGFGTESDRETFKSNVNKLSAIRSEITKYETMYKNDYIVGLVIHSLMWSMVTFLPLITVVRPISFLILVIVNTTVHSIIDNYKCNKYAINLCADQILHLMQILGTIAIMLFV